MAAARAVRGVATGREGAQRAHGARARVQLVGSQYIKMTLYQNDPGGPPAVSSLACARIVVVTQDLDCPTTGCARRTRPALKPSQRAPYHAVKVETETSRHLVARAPTMLEQRKYRYGATVWYRLHANAADLSPRTTGTSH